jgi:hypothetical protein
VNALTKHCWLDEAVVSVAQICPCPPPIDRVKAICPLFARVVVFTVQVREPEFEKVPVTLYDVPLTAIVVGYPEPSKAGQ